MERKIDWLKKKGLWNELTDYYIFKKNINDNPDKHSRSIFAESVNEMCQKNCYQKFIPIEEVTEIPNTYNGKYYVCSRVI